MTWEVLISSTISGVGWRVELFHLKGRDLEQPCFNGFILSGFYTCNRASRCSIIGGFDITTFQTPQCQEKASPAYTSHNKVCHVPYPTTTDRKRGSCQRGRVEWRLHPLRRVRLSLGLRYDWTVPRWRWSKLQVFEEGRIYLRTNVMFESIVWCFLCFRHTSQTFQTDVWLLVQWFLYRNWFNLQMSVVFGNSSECCSICHKRSSDGRTPPEIVVTCCDCDCISQSILSPVGGLQSRFLYTFQFLFWGEVHQQIYLATSHCFGSYSLLLRRWLTYRRWWFLDTHFHRSARTLGPLGTRWHEPS